MDRSFLITVGTSLIERYLEEKQGSRNFNNVELVNTTCNMNFEDNLDLEGIHNKILSNSSNTNAEADNYRLAYNEINIWAEDFLEEDSKELENISAELKTLLKLGIDFSSNDEIYLFPTFTYGGIFCAKILKGILSKITNGAMIETVFTRGLNSAQDEDFAKEGIPNFLDNIYRKVKESEEKGKEVYLLISGGYKSIIPYTTLVGLLTHHKLYYIYEDSDTLIELPTLPIGIDMNVFRPNYTVIRNIEFTKDKSHFDNLDESLKSLFEVDSKGNIVPKPFLQFLINIFLNSVSKSSLTLQAGNMSVLKYLQNDTKLYENFMQLNDIGSFLWIGDKVPEMVDHALKHHDNLFALTDLILAPILNSNNSTCNGKPFISKEELFILLCTIYLHDFGHVLSYFPSVPNRKLLASEIREYHHVLGYKRLTKHKETLMLLSSLLNWVDKDGKDEKTIEREYIVKYFNAIATIGLYHRKIMPLKKEEPCFKFKVGRENFQFNALGDQQIYFDGKEISSDRVLFITSLFRVIDSLDNQFARIGEINEFLFRIISLINDTKEELRRADEIGKLLGPNKEKIDFLYDSIEKNYEQSPPLCIDDEVEKLADSKKLDRNIIFLYLDAKSRAFMKQNQFKHYLKHLFLDVPYISYKFDSENNKHIITVTIKKSKEFDKNIKVLNEKLDSIDSKQDEVIKKLKEAIEIYKNPDCDKIFKDIASDYEIVKEILKENCLVFEFENEIHNG